MKPKDFTHVQHFPGTTGNRFDVILHQANELERWPVVVFALALLAIALLFNLTQWGEALILWLFFLDDWGLLALLPRQGRSFGPARPTALILAILRAIASLLPPLINWPLQVIGTLLVVYGFWIEPHRIRLTRQKLVSPRFHPERPLRLLHLSDLHVERISPRDRQLNALIQELQPDLIVFTGDFLNLSYRTDPVAREEARKIIRDWRAPLGVYVVTGSPAVDLADFVPELIEGLPVHWLQRDRCTLSFAGDQLDLVGLTCSHKPFEDAQVLRQVLGEMAGRFTILLYHSPDLAPEAAQLGVDLQLSGHTHGGQVRLPLIGALFTGSLYGLAFQAGLYQIEKLTLYISRGLGLEGAAAPRVRFLCPPEAILWEISGESTPDQG